MEQQATIRPELMKKFRELEEAKKRAPGEQFSRAVYGSAEKIKNFGQEAPQVNAFFQPFSKGGEQSEAAIWGFGDAYGSAMAKVITGEESLGAAMEQATKQLVMQIGERALINGMLNRGALFF